MLMVVFSDGYSTLPGSPRHKVSTAEIQRYALRTIQTNMLRMVHELLHAVGRDRTFTDQEVADAAVSIDPKLPKGGAYNKFNGFIRKHCTNYIGAK